MNGFREYLWTWLIGADYMEENFCDADDLTASMVETETLASADDMMDAWNAYVAACGEKGDEPVNDLEGFEP